MANLSNSEIREIEQRLGFGQSPLLEWECEHDVFHKEKTYISNLNIRWNDDVDVDDSELIWADQLDEDDIEWAEGEEIVEMLSTGEIKIIQAHWGMGEPWVIDIYEIPEWQWNQKKNKYEIIMVKVQFETQLEVWKENPKRDSKNNPESRQARFEAQCAESESDFEDHPKDDPDRSFGRVWSRKWCKLEDKEAKAKKKKETQNLNKKIQSYIR